MNKKTTTKFALASSPTKKLPKQQKPSPECEKNVRRQFPDSTLKERERETETAVQRLPLGIRRALH